MLPCSSRDQQLTGDAPVLQSAGRQDVLTLSAAALVTAGAQFECTLLARARARTSNDHRGLKADGVREREDGFLHDETDDRDRERQETLPEALRLCERHHEARQECLQAVHGVNVATGDRGAG